MADTMNRDDVERIARSALKDLGVDASALSVRPVEAQPGQWRIEIRAGSAPLVITCGPGSSAQWVRDQVREKYLAQH
jgi:hypothetical protein